MEIPIQYKTCIIVFPVLFSSLLVVLFVLDVFKIVINFMISDLLVAMRVDVIVVMTVVVDLVRCPPQISTPNMQV